MLRCMNDMVRRDNEQITGDPNWQIKTDADAETLFQWWATVKGFQGRPNPIKDRHLRYSKDRVFGYVSDGRWVANCTCNGGIAVQPGITVGCCFDCGTVHPVRFPTEAAEIAAVLVKRPKAANRNWFPGETVAMLHAENLEHSV